MRSIPTKMRTLLGATHISVSKNGVVTLRQRNSCQTVAHLEGGRIRHHLDMDGHEHPAAWREAIEQLIMETTP